MALEQEDGVLGMMIDSGTATDASVASATSSPIVPETTPPPEDISETRAETPIGRLSLRVDSPQRVTEGNSAFVSYLITSQGEGQPAERVRRRFSEFAKLYDQLVSDYPACAVPPLPDRSRLEYIAGDRFSPEFTSRRAASLERFLFRVTQHPELGKSRALAAFLAPRDLNARARRQGLAGHIPSDGSGVLDSISDTLVNAFAKVKNQSKEMVDARDRASRFEHSVASVDKAVVHLGRNQQELVQDFEDMHRQAMRLGKLEPAVSSEFGHLATTAKALASATAALRVGIDTGFAGALRDMAHYVQAVKGMLKQREQRQIDYEALVEYLERSEAELAAAKQGSAGGYLRTKVNDLRGVDKEQARKQRVTKLGSRIQELRDEVSLARKVSDDFEALAKREVKVFERIESMELQTCLTGLADSYIEYFQRVLKECQEIESQL